MSAADTIRTFALRAAQASLWLFVFSIPMEKSVEIPGLGTISKLFGLIAIAIGVTALMIRRELRLPSSYHCTAALFFAWSAATYVWSLSAELTEERINTNVQLFAVVVLIWQFCRTERDLHWQLTAYVTGTVVPALDTVQRFLSGQQTYYGRYATTGFDPNDLAITLALSLPMSYYLSLVARSRWAKTACWFQMAAALMIVLLTASRTGMMASLVALTLILTTAGHLSIAARRGLVVATLALAGLAALVIPAKSFARLATVGSEVTEGNLNSRTVLWTYGWRAFLDVPVQGVGSGAYPETVVNAIGRERDFTPVAHNSFLSILVETGLVGATLFIGSLCLLAGGAWRLPSPARQFWLTALAVWMVGVMALTWEQRKPTWVVFALMAAHAGTVRRTSRVDETQQAPWTYRAAWEGAA